MNTAPIDFSALVSQDELPKPNIGKWTVYCIGALLAPLIFFGVISFLIQKDILVIAYIIDSIILTIGVSALILKVLIHHEKYKYETKAEFLFFSQANGWNYSVPQFYNEENISPIPPELAILNKRRLLYKNLFNPHFCIEGEIANYHFRYTSTTYSIPYREGAIGYLTVLYVESKDGQSLQRPKKFMNHTVNQLSNSSWMISVPFILKSKEEVEKFFRIAGLSATNNYSSNETGIHLGRKLLQQIIASCAIAFIVAACIFLYAVRDTYR